MKRIEKIVVASLVISFELKNAQRLLIDQTVFENNWADTQNGFAILFTPVGENGVAPWATVQDVTFTNNIARSNLYGVLGSDRSPGLDSLGFYFPGYDFKKNVIVGVPRGTIYTADNFLPLVLSLVGFVDMAGGNYRLAPTSPYKKAGADGKDIGCDFDALNPERTTNRRQTGTVPRASASG
jgi:hypothetical protein